jgi:hypothetical protein
MRFIIPPNSIFPAHDFQVLADWFVDCGLVLSDINGSHPIWIDTDDSVMCVTTYGIAKAPAKPGPYRSVALRVLTSAEMRTMDPLPDLMELAEQLAKQLEPEMVNQIGVTVKDVAQPEPVDEATELATVAMDEFKSLVDQLAEARQAEKDAKDRAQEARDQIIAFLRDSKADIGTIAGRPAVEWKQLAPRKFKTGKFAVDHPDLYEQYREESPESRLDLL